MCMLSLAGCSALRHRQHETMITSALQTKRESLETICLSDSLAKTLSLCADSIDLRFSDSIVTVHAVNVKICRQSQTRHCYEQTEQQSDTLTHQQYLIQSDAVQTETGIVATAHNGRGSPWPWILTAVLIVIGFSLLLWHKHWK